MSGAILGVDAILVRVEVDVGRGLPAMSVVGLPESAVREGRERVAAALANSGFTVPPRRITINLAPADLRKDGSAFDLPLAIGLLAATGIVEPSRVAGHCLVGELGLDGSIRPVRGVLPIALRCRREAVATLVTAVSNRGEATLVEGLTVLTPATLADLVAHFAGRRTLAPARPDPVDPGREVDLDLSDVAGQGHARRALEVAAAGGHGLLLIGPPGAGKSMLARRLPTILPPPGAAESLEITAVHSVAGRLGPGGAVRTRPFRAPHHTVSDAGLVGGGSPPRPGEVSLAHRGVLFLDELPEFRRHVLEALRQPLEDGVVRIGRARHTITFPARVMLVAAMNPCPCGYHGTGDRCACHPGQVDRYRGRISGPLLDRIDLHLEMQPPTSAQLGSAGGESSAAVRVRVERAVARQCARGVRNGEMDARAIRRICAPDADALHLLRAAFERLGLSARAYHRILRVARTIADLAGTEAIGAAHMAEAIQYRALDRRPPPGGL